MDKANPESIVPVQLGNLARRCQSIGDINTIFGDTFDGMGWERECSEVFLTLHRVRKNGTPLKTPDVEIWFEEFHIDIRYEEDANGDLVGRVLPRTRRREMPWVVRGRNVKGRAFSSLANAIEVFVGIALKLAPIP